jgi:hypothetical protein
MTPGCSRNALARLGALAAVAAVLVTATTTGRGQPPPGGAGPTRRFISAKDCARCHRPPPAGSEPLFAGDPGMPKLVRFDESKTWSEADKHSRAYDALTGPRGQKMGALLGLKDVKSERSCLSCHATGFLPADTVEVRAEAVKAVDQGVNCSACHGPYLEWVENHGLTADQARRWRLKTTDLRDPSTRAGVCYSCHVGDAGEGKVVTHAMYASGHPPLPGIEVATFLETMPPHWSRPDQVEAFQKDKGLRERCHVDFSEPQATKAVVIGGVVALRDAMRLLAHQAEPEPTPLGALGKAWPDYAQFECAACHHELLAPGSARGRLARGFDHHVDGQTVAGVPGRPQFRPWTLALAGLALAQTGGTGRDAYRGAVKELYAALDARPFGDPSAVNRAAKRLEAWSAEALDALKGSRFDATSPPRLLAALVRTPADEVPASDYDSARQVAWAFRSIYSDWQPKPANDARIVAVLADLDRSLKLNPYSEREPRTKLATSPGLSGGPLRDALLRLSEGEFRTSIARAADYDPTAFKQALGRLRELIPQPTAP